MKRKHILFTFSILTSFIMTFSLAKTANGNRSGAPGGNTGAPGESSCAKSSCHSDGGAAQEVPGLVTSDIPGTGYVPGQTYTITATATKMGGSRFGFQITAKDGADQLSGTFKAVNSNTLSIINKYITHTSAGTAGTDTKVWTTEWTAPASATGNITFYAAFNLANNDNTRFGDEIVTSTLTVSMDPTASVSDLEQDKINIYPAPFRDEITFELPSGSAKVDVYNVSGQLVHSFISNDGGTVKKQLGWLQNGIYFVQIQTDERLYSQRIVKVL